MEIKKTESKKKKETWRNQKKRIKLKKKKNEKKGKGREKIKKKIISKIIIMSSLVDMLIDGHVIDIIWKFMISEGSLAYQSLI